MWELWVVVAQRGRCCRRPGRCPGLNALTLSGCRGPHGVFSLKGWEFLAQGIALGFWGIACVALPEPTGAMPRSEFSHPFRVKNVSRGFQPERLRVFSPGHRPGL